MIDPPSQDNFYRDLLDQFQEGVYFVDRDRKVIFWNKAAERITGYSAEEVLGKSCADNVLRHVSESGVQLCLKGCPLAETMNDGRNREANVYLHHKDGHRIPFTVRGAPYRNDLGEILGAMEVFSDNTSRVDVIHQLEQLKQEVLTDPLTAVGNRRMADLELQRRQSEARDIGIPYGLLFVDIDHFKAVNDTYGSSRWWRAP